MPVDESRTSEWETPTEFFCRALRLPTSVVELLMRHRRPTTDLLEQRRAWVIEIPTLVFAVLAVTTLPLVVLTRSPFLAVWIVVAALATVNYLLMMRARARVVVTMTLLTATWLPVANLGHAPGDVVPLTFMGGMFALIVAALLEPVSSTLIYGLMTEAALQLTVYLHGNSPFLVQLSGGVLLLTAVAAAGSWATDRAFGNLASALARNEDLSHRLRGINAALEGTNIELENRVAERTRELAELLIRDDLTGLFNRRYFTTEMEARQQDERHCTLMMVDVDHFKAVNDAVGHAVGDEVLRRVATTMRRHLRGEDFVARIGGEEFVVVLTDHDCETARIMAERLRQAVQDEDWANIPVPNGRVTVSIGMANTVLATPASLRDLMHRADQALYAAKASGRNQVVTDPSLIPGQHTSSMLHAR